MTKEATRKEDHNFQIIPIIFYSHTVDCLTIKDIATNLMLTKPNAIDSTITFCRHPLLHSSINNTFLSAINQSAISAISVIIAAKVCMVKIKTMRFDWLQGYYRNSSTSSNSIAIVVYDIINRRKSIQRVFDCGIEQSLSFAWCVNSIDTHLFKSSIGVEQLQDTHN